jgi:hypothetical protein
MELCHAVTAISVGFLGFVRAIYAMNGWLGQRTATDAHNCCGCESGWWAKLPPAARNTCVALQLVESSLCMHFIAPLFYLLACSLSPMF